MTNNNISLFAISFKQGFVSPNIPIATFYQGDKKINFLLDTGSDKNVVNIKALDNIEHQVIEDDEHTFTITGVGGTKEVSMCSIPFSCDDKEYKAEFLATDLSEAFGVIEKDHSIILHGIIGSRFLRENNIVLDFKNLAAYSKE